MSTRLPEEKDKLPEKQENQDKIQKLLKNISGTTDKIKSFVKESKNEPIDIKSIEKKLGIIEKKLKTIENKFKDSSQQDTKKKRDLCNTLCEFWDTIKKKINKKRVETESIYLNPDSIYDEFRIRYSKAFAPWPNLYLVILGIFYIFSAIILFFVFKFNLSQVSLIFLPQSIKKGLVIIEPFICFVFNFFIICNKKNKRQENFLLFILCIWISATLIQVFEFKVMSSRLIFLFNMCFLSIFIIGIIDYDYTNYPDDIRKKARDLLVKILDEKSLDNEKAFTYNFLLNYSTSIEDDLVSAIRKSKKLFSRVSFILGFIFATKIELLKDSIQLILKSSKVIPEQDLIYRMFIIDVLLIVAVPIYGEYKSFNWKSDLYKTALKDQQLLLSKKQSSKYEEN